ncbi:MAG TPA: class I SAM-dependent methyltransferase [Vicinamibacteria bacterium]|nr:class I SAM-dependent methyltransferase [Vicinamibacteria bacterium]
MSTGAPTRYDRTYYDKWYRDPRHRVHTRAERARAVRMTVALAEFLLGRTVRSVLDVGSGEGQWRDLLRAVRPRARYVGVDPSEYAVRRFGRPRGLRLGSIEELPTLRLRGPFDLVVCAGVLNYLRPDALEKGLANLRPLAGGVAFLEIFAREDEVVGCLRGFDRRPRAFYRRLLARHGFAHCGPHAYASAELARGLASFERVKG